MIKHKRIEIITALLMTSVVLLTLFTLLNPDVFADFAKPYSPAYASVMDKTKVLEIEIIADEADWENMLKTATSEQYIMATVIINGKKIENAGIRPKGNSSLSTVAQDSTTDRYSFKIEFDHYIKNQTWLGLDKLAINNMQGDASYMKEYLSYDIMSYIGVDAPLYTFSNITVNGEVWGFYLAVEVLEDSYVSRVYGNDYGELYKPESMGGRGEGRMNEFIQRAEQGNELEQEQFNPQMQQPQFEQEEGFRREEFNPQMQQSQSGQNQPENQRQQRRADNNFGDFNNTENGVNAAEGMGARDFAGGFGGMGGMSSGGVSLEYTDDEISSYSAIFDNAVLKSNEDDYMRVIESLKKLSAGEDLESVVDVEAVLRYFAAHTVVVNLDSYISNMAHNYYLYEKDGMLTILPWDYNLSFGGFQSGSASSVVNFPIDTPVSGVSLDNRPLLGKLFEIPEYLEMYHSYLQEIVDGYFNSGLFEQTISSLNELISLYVESDPSAFYSYQSYKSAVVELEKLGLLRAESIEGQLNGTVPSTSQGQSAELDKLIDASGVNLSALGSQGGGGRGQEGFANGGMNRPQGGFVMRDTNSE